MIDEARQLEVPEVTMTEEEILRPYTLEELRRKIDEADEAIAQGAVGLSTRSI